MGATSFVRGHPVWFTDTWRYADTGEPVGEGDRLCVKCGQPPTPEGYDACLGFIPGASSACCGHGVTEPIMVRRDD